MPIKSEALLIGINYVDTPDAHLNGCVNDVTKISEFLNTKLGFKKESIKLYHDEDPLLKKNTTALGILTVLRDLVVRSWKEQLDMVWIHYSGHGCGIRDTTGDEIDGQDECLIPSDFRKFGVITDDYLKSIFQNFNPKTKVICVFDCCHSGSILDLKYRYVNSNSVEEEFQGKECPAKILMLSGCSDAQTSADAFNVMNNNQFSGALTACLIMSYEQACNLDIFVLLRKVHDMLKARGFTQFPQLCSTYDLRNDKKLLL